MTCRDHSGLVHPGRPGGPSRHAAPAETSCLRETRPRWTFAIAAILWSRVPLTDKSSRAPITLTRWGGFWSSSAPKDRRALSTLVARQKLSTLARATLEVILGLSTPRSSRGMGRFPFPGAVFSRRRHKGARWRDKGVTVGRGLTHGQRERFAQSACRFGARVHLPLALLPLCPLPEPLRLAPNVSAPACWTGRSCPHRAAGSTGRSCPQRATSMIVRTASRPLSCWVSSPGAAAMKRAFERENHSRTRPSSPVEWLRLERSATTRPLASPARIRRRA